jgi:predicted nuclease of predicted toxin-antitoxin system
MQILIDVGLPIEAKDDEIWRLAQSRGMVILTNNRNRKDETSLTAVISRENSEVSLPIVTVGNAERLAESGYRQAAALRLAEILFYLEDNLGAGRLFIP